MTDGELLTGSSIVLDTMCLMHHAKADRLDVLADLSRESSCHSTVVVRDELLQKSSSEPRVMNALSLPWLDFAPMDDMADLSSFATWQARVGGDRFDLGAASVFSVAEKLGAIAITDDEDAKRVARRNGLVVHGNPWLLAQSCRAGKLPVCGAATIVDLLRETGLRPPCGGTDYESWARSHGLM